MEGISPPIFSSYRSATCPRLGRSWVWVSASWSWPRLHTDPARQSRTPGCLLLYHPPPGDCLHTNSSDHCPHPPLWTNSSCESASCNITENWLYEACEVYSYFTDVVSSECWWWNCSAWVSLSSDSWQFTMNRVISLNYVHPSHPPCCSLTIDKININLQHK